MCLICIAFASWVLKTANPQVGDAWKAGMFVESERKAQGFAYQDYIQEFPMLNMCLY